MYLEEYEGQIDIEAAEYAHQQRYRAYEEYMKELYWIEHPGTSIDTLVEAVTTESIVASDSKRVLKNRQLEVFAWLHTQPENVRADLLAKISE